MTDGRWDTALLMFLTLFALYSPLAALPSYMPIVGGYSSADQRRLATGLFVNVAAFVFAGIWVGEVLLEVLGISTAALTAAGGIALLYESVPLMRGTHEAPLLGEAGITEGAAPTPDRSWRSILLTPVTFPLTVGGATFGVLVGFAATSQSVGDRGALTVAGLAYAAVTGITLYLAGHVHRRITDLGRSMPRPHRRHPPHVHRSHAAGQWRHAARSRRPRLDQGLIQPGRHDIPSARSRQRYPSRRSFFMAKLPHIGGRYVVKSRWVTTAAVAISGAMPNAVRPERCDPRTIRDTWLSEVQAA